ncbi:MAG TPA: pyrroloquinoline quinone-dependent dehydrogenase [Edaphobacter sp.]|jgi:quinoprotein glucose dehydrogenase
MPTLLETYPKTRKDKVTRTLLGTLLLCLHLSVANAQTIAPVGDGWPTYGGDPGGLRFSKSSQITRNNLAQLHLVWTFHTHAVDSEAKRAELPSFEATPVLSGDTLYLASPFDVVFALNARNGSERWQYDPKFRGRPPDGLVASRGVALWPLAAVVKPKAPACSYRVFLGTLDARLLALDASTGKVCAGFGDNGTVDLRQGVHYQSIGYGMTSPPTVIGNVVVVGSTVADNQQVDIESGLVRGYDAVTGKLIWSWEPLPWAGKQKVRTGAGNVWSVISADPTLGLVYLPTGSAAPDFYGGMRPGDNRDANSIVALDAATGKKVWAFQVVHHDIWDYDIASEPVLFTWRGSTPAIAITTKMGMIFLLDRRTGQPLVPVEERPVPQSDVPGEQSYPTQPFQKIPTLAPTVMELTDSMVYQRSSADAGICRKQIAGLRYDGIYTPASLKGSLNYPGPGGGVNWGGAAIDPATGILYANTNRLASVLRLVPRYGAEGVNYWMSINLFNWWLWLLLFLVVFLISLVLHRFRRAPAIVALACAVVLGGRYFDLVVWLLLFLVVLVISCVRHRRRSNPGWAPVNVVLACAVAFGGRYIEASLFPRSNMPRIDHFAYELSQQRKSPYLIERHPLVDSRGFNCTPAPWGGITAVNLNTLTKVWEKPLGTMVPNQRTGIRNFGGPIVTVSGLVITAGAEDLWLRVFDSGTGEELQKIPLPVPAVATPMTYTLDGRQYIVVAAGGHGDGFTPLGDSLMAFAVN